MVNKIGAFRKFYSILLTMSIIGILILAVPSQALTITLSPPSDSKVELGNEVSFTATFNIKTDEQVPIRDLNVKVGNDICEFDVDGTLLSGCTGVTVEVIKFDSLYLIGDNKFKYLGDNYDYGYGYGYGYSKHSGNGEIVYKITIDSNEFSLGKYDVSVQANFDNGISTSPGDQLHSGTHKFEIIPVKIKGKK